MTGRHQIEEAITNELNRRAEASNPQPDFDVFVEQLGSDRQAVNPVSSADQPRLRGRLVLATAAAVIIGAGLLALNAFPRDGVETTLAWSQEDSSDLYYWPSALPSGWEMIDSQRTIIEHDPQGGRVLAATAPGDQLIGIEVALDDGAEADQQLVSARIIDGVEYGIVYVDQWDTVLTWETDGYRFNLWARQVDVEEVFRLAAGVAAQYDPETGVFSELDAPFTPEWEILVDRQRDDGADELTHTFRLGCPEVDPGEGCALQVTIAPPFLGSAEYAMVDRRVGMINSEHSTVCGDVTIGTQQVGPMDLSTATSVLANGFVVWIGPDFGPPDQPYGTGAIGVGHSPIRLAEIETILCNLDTVDAATFNQLSDTTD